MADYGIRVSRSGYDVDTASDKELALSSEWPLLPLEAEGVFEVNNTLSQPVTIYNHNLGYAPVFKVYYTSAFYDSDWFYNAATISAIGTTCRVDTNNLIWKDVWFSATPMYLHWKIFRRPITTNFNEPNYILTDTTKSTFNDYGLIVSKVGKDVGSTDFRDFSMRSDCRQLLVDQSAYTTTPDYTMTMTHNLGYPPIFWAYYQDTSNQWERLIQSYTVRTAVTDSSITIDLPSAFWGSPPPNIALLTFKNTLNSNG